MLDYIKLFDQFNKVAPLRKFEIILTAGLAMAGTVAILLIGKDKLFSFLSQFERHSFNYIQTLSFLFFIVTVMLAFFWVASVLLKILWVDRYYKNLMPPPPNGAILIAMLMGGVMVVLAYLSDSILNYSACYLIFALVNLLSDATSSNEVDKALVAHDMSAGGSLSEDLKKEIRLYYLQ